MNYDPQLHRKVMLAHYTRLGALPGWKPYVSARLKELERLDPVLYAGCHETVNQAVKALEAQSSLPPSSLTTEPQTRDTAAN